MIDVILVEPQTLFRVAMQHLLSNYPTIRLKSNFDTGKAISIAPVNTFDKLIIILSTNIRDVSLVSLIKKLKRDNVHAKLLVLADEEKLNLAEQYRMAGAHGYIAKIITEERFIQALTKVWQDESVWPDNITQRQTNQNNPLLGVLSGKEIEVMTYMLKGKSIQNIAKILCLSPKTISTYKGHIFKKMRLNSMMDVFIFGIESGLIKLENITTSKY